MDTKSTVEIEVRGISLTKEEKEKMTKAAFDALNGVVEQQNLFDMVEEPEKRSFKDRIDDLKWNMGVKKDMAKAKWNMVRPETKLAIFAVGLPAVTKSVLSIVNEARLVKKEHRLQKEAKKRDKNRK